MRFEELAYRDGGQAVTIPFHRTLTVLGGLDADSRRRFAEQSVASLAGDPAGYGVSLVFVDGSGSRVHLVRDPRGGATVTDLDSGEDLADALADPAGNVNWLRLFGLGSSDLLVLNGAEFEKDAAAGDPNGPGPEPDGELREARTVLAQVEDEYQRVLAQHRHVAELRAEITRLDEEIRHADDRAARQRYDDAARTVARLEAELALLNGAEPEEIRVAQSAVAAVRLAAEHRDATAALDAARSAFGKRRRLDQRALERALELPTDPPENLEQLHAQYLAASTRRAELVARLNAGAASDLPTPSAPWVFTFAHLDHRELWKRAERVSNARTRVAKLSMGLGGAGQHGELVARIEAAHQLVEEAEREVDSTRIRALGVAAKRRLQKAQEDEQAILEEAGFVSWLTFQMRRIDVLLEPDALEALRVAELEHQVAAVAWAELAGDVDPDDALAARDEIERCTMAMANAEHHAEASELLYKELTHEVEPDFVAAEAALLAVCGPFGVELEHAVSEIGAIVSEGRVARLQQTLDAAEAAQRRIEAELEEHLASAGRPGPGHLAARIEAVAEMADAAALHLEATQSTRNPEEVEADLDRARATVRRLARPEWENLPTPSAFHGQGPSVDDAGTDPAAILVEDRARAVAELETASRTLVDVDRLADRRDALSRRVAVLEAADSTGSNLVSAEEAEMVLLGRFAQTRRVGPEAEPVPVVVDDAIASFPRHDKWRLLDLLARLGEASQVVYLTDDEETLEWARSRSASGGIGLLLPAPIASVA